MQFRKRLLSSRIAFIITASGMLAASSFSSSTHAQSSSQWSCVAADDGQWRCEEIRPATRSAARPASSARQTGSPTRTPARQGTATGQRAADLDWRPRQQLDPEQLQDLPSFCCGMFVEPERSGPEANDEPETSPIHIETGQDISQPETGRSVVTGPVSIQQGYRSLQASEYTDINRNVDTVSLRGDVIFREPGVLLRGSSALLDMNTDSSTIEEASYVLHDNGVHGSARRIIYNSVDGTVMIENGEFSRCEPGDEFWVLRADAIELDPAAGVGYARAVSLRIKDLPVFYYPFTLPFPIGDQRVSGFLAPSISNSRRGGLDLAIPYYLNLAPHYDATLTPRLISEHGGMLDAELRYLASWSMNTVNLAVLPSDKQYDEEIAHIPGSDSPSSRDRWFLGFEHNGALGDNWSSFVDYSAVSDQDYFRDLGSRGLNVESRTHLNKQGQINFHSANWRATSKVQRIELIDPLAASIDINKPYDRLPELNVAGDFQLDSGLQYGFQASHVHFDRDLDRQMLAPEQVINGALVTGERFNAEPYISWPLRAPGGFLVPTARYRHASWQLDDQALGTTGQPSVGVGVFSLDSGLIFERPWTFVGGRFTQTLEPRLFYLYSEYEDQSEIPVFDTSQLNFGFNQLFRDNRFSGGDRFGDANQLSAALSSRLIDAQGRERARLSIGQIFYFEDRQVSLDSPLQSWQILQPMDISRSALIAELDYRLHNNWQLRTNLQWNEDQQRLDEGSIAFHYQSDMNHIFNIAYRYRENVDIFLPSPPQIDPRIKQTDVSAIWPLNDSWRFLGRWNYDHSNRRNLETFAGVEYSNCCATIRVVAREWIDQYEYLLLQDRPNRGIFLQFTLTGLGDITGGGISRLLTDGVAGFKEYQFNE